VNTTLSQKTGTPVIPVLYFNYSMEIGGIETLIYEFASRLNNNGYLTSVCVLKGEGILEERLGKENVRVYDIAKKEGIDISVVLKLRRLIIQKGIRILHTNNFTSWLYGVLASRGVKGVRHIHTEHSNVKRKRRGWGEKLLCHYTDFVICVSDDVRDFMINNQSIPEKQLRVIHNGVDSDKFSPSAERKEHIRTQLGIRYNRPVVGIVARLDPIKDHRTLLKAFALLSDNIPDALLLIIGDGEMRASLESLNRALGLENNVRFLGERQDIPDLLNAMDIFVLTSLSEGHNVSLLESMSSGLPVVATSVGGNVEIVRDKETGLLVPPDNPEELSAKLGVMLRDEALRMKMGEKGRARVLECFDLQAMLENYKGVYKKVLE
jgi:sugar transferase (PEP-CTERM/EpsH1 system associated)